MRLLRLYVEQQAAHEAVWLLESRGIPAYTKPDRSNIRVGDTQSAVYIYFERQAEDALRLLEDP